jgi:hypothetical protein
MANECTVDVISKPNHWLRIVQELLSQAGIVINGLNPGISGCTIPVFLNAYYSKVRSAWRKLYGRLVGL